MGFVDFISGLFGGLGSLLGQIVQFLIEFVNVVVQALTFLWNGIITVLQYALKGLQSIGTFFKHLWDGFFKNLFTQIAKAVRSVHDFLEKHLRPIINFLKKARAIIDRIYKQYIRPYLQFLQRIRKWLAILRLLHIKFADVLDRRIAQTEARIASQFLLVRGLLNDVINFVNSVADPRRLSRMVLVSIAGRRTAAAVVRAVTGLPMGFFFPHTGKGALPFEKPVASYSQLVDPAINQPVSAILGGLLPLPVDGFDDVDPTPDASELDSVETSPYFSQYADAMLTAEIKYDSIPDVPISLTEAIERGTGLIADAGKAVNLGV